MPENVIIRNKMPESLGVGQNIPDSFVVIDLETTGLNPKTDKIVEIGAVKVKEGIITEYFERQVNPGRKLEERITELTGITDDELEKAPYIEEVLPELLDFIGENILVGHRVLFDFSFLKKAAVNMKLTFEKKGIDTLKLARRFLPELESKRLTFLCEYYGIPLKAHRAVEDAKATALLYGKLAQAFPQEDAYQPVPLIYKVKKEGPITSKQKERLYKLIEQHKLIVDFDVDKLTKNEASRITDKILSKYGRL